MGTVLVIDTATAMTTNDKLAKTKAAAKDYVAHKQPNEVIAVVAAGAVPRVVIPFTANVAELNSAIDHLAPEGQEALYDALEAGSALYADRPELLGTMIVVATGGDQVSSTSGGNAVAALQASQAAVFTLGIPGGPGYSASVMEQLAVNGGQYVAVTDPNEIGSAFGAVQGALQQGVQLSYSSKSKATDALAITVAAQGEAVHVHTVPGAVAVGTNAVPETVTTAPGTRALQ